MMYIIHVQVDYLYVFQAVTDVDQALLKEAHASLMTLSLEAARTDSDSAIIRLAYNIQVP